LIRSRSAGGGGGGGRGDGDGREFFGGFILFFSGFHQKPHPAASRLLLFFNLILILILERTSTMKKKSFESYIIQQKGEGREGGGSPSAQMLFSFSV
jgi:hypothetical protein